MDCDMKRLNELMEKVRSLSEEQSGHLRDLRLVEMLKAQEQRDGIFVELSRLGIERQGNSDLKTIVRRLMENDKRMMVNMLSTMDEIKSSLNKIGHGRKAVKAYAGK